MTTSSKNICDKSSEGSRSIGESFEIYFASLDRDAARKVNWDKLTTASSAVISCSTRSIVQTFSNDSSVYIDARSLAEDDVNCKM